MFTLRRCNSVSAASSDDGYIILKVRSAACRSSSGGVPSNDEARERERNGTINRELAILKAMYNHGASVNDPPLVSRVPRFPAKLRESDPRRGWLTDAQYDTLQSKCKHQWLRGLLAVAFAFGLRKAELLRLRVQDVNLKDRTIKLLPGTTKTDKGRTIKMTEDVFENLKPCVEGKESTDPVFTWADGSPVCAAISQSPALRWSKGL
jgi:integrase